MTRKQYFLKDEQCDFLEQFENEAEIVRRAIDDYIEKYKGTSTTSLSEKGGDHGSI